MGIHEITIQSPNRLYKAPTDYTKPQQTIQNPDILDKAPTDNTTPLKTTQSPGLQRSPTPRTGMGVTPDRYGGHPGPVWGSPRTGMGVAPDRYGGPGIGIINIGYIELGLYFCRFSEKPKMSKNRQKSIFLNVLWSASPVQIQPNTRIKSNMVTN